MQQRHWDIAYNIICWLIIQYPIHRNKKIRNQFSLLAQVAKHLPLKNEPIYSYRSNIQLLYSYTYKENFLGWLKIVEDDDNPKGDMFSHPYELTTIFTQTHSDPSGKSCYVKKKNSKTFLVFYHAKWLKLNISRVLPHQTVKIEINLHFFQPN